MAWPEGERQGRPFYGGLVDVSRTGGRLYLTWRVRVGEVLALGLRAAKSPQVVRMPFRVVRVESDELGHPEFIAARLHLMRTLAQTGHPEGRMAFGWVAGGRWEPGVSPDAVRAIQKLFEDQEERPRRRILPEVRVPGEDVVIPQIIGLR